MSYILAPVVDTSSFVSNPLTADLEAGGNNITGAGTVSASVGDMSTVSIATQLSTNAGSLLGFFGVAPTPQGAPIVRVAGGSPSEDAINAIITILEQIGVIAI